MKKKTWLSWSSGKDSAWSLYRLRQEPDIEVTGLVTTVNERHQRVAMHAVRLSLLQAQAEAAGVPLHVVPIPSPCSNEAYEAAMRRLIEEAKQEGVTQMAFGDLFLEDIRAYREQQLSGTGITPLFPLWQIPTDRLAQEMIAGGLSAVITCIDPRHLAPTFAGRTFNASFLDDLPKEVDPCGERGEFHSFAVAGPMFRHPISVTVGEVVTRDGFVFADLLPAAEAVR
ncbi:adenine nucleotide alpha hydrolase [Candidatus Manganitrophus noduliformans]|uniref:Adenine nucleotide alpha hydrolase n=1 Tax=Candidatus Manganitrophus noduliformans TaxID=2606439 RepID=A0A7X6DR92_9BACT|nr:adenine nucleotide alpha hydrolase [Candidatus Manganitrophus noduliformans]NKE71911.1 adenine nucleotide alpha hydrolase [Candidatus Manganitrophus noduliformans]